jgi:predicted DNA-binding transcriptional regulator AlpA
MTVVTDTPPRRKAESRLLRFSDLQARGIVVNWTTLHRWVARGNFPPGRYLGPSTRVWTEAEIEEWLASRPTSKAGAA